MSIERVIEALLVAGALVLPILFVPMLRDAFALPKTAAMVGLGGLVALGLLWARRVTPVASAPSRLAVTDILVVYMVLTTAATLRSQDPVHSLVGEPLQYQGLLASVGYALAYLAARATITSWDRTRQLMGGVAAASVVVVIYGLLQQAGLDPIWSVLNKGRVFSSVGQANNLAAYMVLAMPIVTALAITSRGRSRHAFGVVAAAVALVLALTFSRGGYLGGLAAMAVFGALAFRPRAVAPRRAATAAAAMALVIGLGVLLPPVADLGRRVTARVQEIAVEESSAALRLDLWRIGVQIALDHPLLGVGPEMFPVVFPKYRDRVLAPERAAVLARFRPESPHSVPIGIAAGMGIPALVAYLALVLATLAIGWRRLCRAPPAGRVLLAGLIAATAGHVVTDLFMTAEVSTSWLFWVVLGVLAAPRPPPDPTDGGAGMEAIAGA